MGPTVRWNPIVYIIFQSYSVINSTVEKAAHSQGYRNQVDA